MPEHLKDDEMLTLDCELSQLLAFEPSADFAAKVRARIEQEPVRANGWRLWILAPLAAAAVIVIAAVMITRTPAVPPDGGAGLQVGRIVPPDGSAGLQAGRPRADVRLSSPPAPSSQIRTTPRPTSVRHVQPTTRPARGSEPEILIDPSLAQAVRRLVAEQRVLPEVPPETTLEPVVVEPLKVPEIASTGGAGL